MKDSPKTCITCMRTAAARDGCSHGECPLRRTVTAQPVGDEYMAAARGVENRVHTGGGSFRREPTTRDSE